MQSGDVARKLFAQIDLNGDGVLSAQEMRAYLERNGEEELGNAIFAQLDVDGDGVVTLEEFLQGFGKMRNKLAKVVDKSSPVFRAVARAARARTYLSARRRTSYRTRGVAASWTS